jgi:hypothetical protein
MALLISVVLLFCWEAFWRGKGFRPYHDDSQDLWSVWRREVPDVHPQDVLILGSSRALFDINLDVWQDELGKKPIMLAGAGKSPGPYLKDLAENTSFSGTLIIGVAPDLFFDLPSSGGWKRAQGWLDYYYDETYAQRLNQAIFMSVDPHFAYINDNLKLKGLVHRLPMPARDSVRPELIWPDMKVMDANRNLQMIPEMAYDTVMQNAYKRIWKGSGWPETDTAAADTIINMYADWAKTLKERGANIIFLRAPSSGEYLEYETKAFPRSDYWDRLIEETGCHGIHFQDYVGLDGYDCPEWSHLLPEDAKIFTKAFIEVLKEEDLIKPTE